MNFSPYVDQPREVTLETFAKCNARCTFCPYTTLERIGTKMSDELIERLMGEMEQWEHPFALTPFKVSEPFLDKRVLPLCAEFNRRIPHGYLRLFTNGSTLTDANVDRVAALSNVFHLWVSLNEYRAEEYEKLMGLDFDRTTANLDRLHARDFPHPVVLSTVGLPNVAFKAYCLRRWPKFSPAVLKRDAWIDFIDPQSPEVPDEPCSRWWELNITATGEAALCCMDAEARYAVGNVHQQTLLEIYNQPKLRERRLHVLSRKVVGEPCARCSY